jgi:chaperonin GroEL
MEQKILFTQEARQKLLDGVNKLADVVSSTLGPSGHSVILDLNGTPVSTKDGVTIAKAINLPEPEENTGAQMLKQASIKTGEEAGDGTTTATVLAREMYKAGMKNQTYNSVEFRKGMDKAVEEVVSYIKTKISKPVTSTEDLKQVATISANGDEEIGKLVSVALDKVGQEGAVTVEESKTGESYLDIVEGIQFDRGYKSPYFVTDNGTMQAILNNPMILLVDKRLGNVKELLPALEYAASQPDSSLLIVAEDIDGEVLSTLILNKVRGGFKVCAVKAPEFGDRRKEVLEDIAILTGGTVISPDKGMKLENFQPEFLGKAKKVTISKDKTTIVEAKGDQEAIDKRVLDIQTLIENAKSIYDKEQYQLRLARLVGGIAVIYVGGHTELEMKERKDRIDDALHATKAALEEGICPGGGKALLAAASHLSMADQCNYSKDWNAGWDTVLEACTAPFHKIVDNTGQTVPVLTKDADNWTSYNPLTQRWEDMYKAGIIDPTKVIRTALKNAVSVAGTMLTSEAVVINIPDKDDHAEDPMQMY